VFEAFFLLAWRFGGLVIGYENDGYFRTGSVTDRMVGWLGTRLVFWGQDLKGRRAARMLLLLGFQFGVFLLHTHTHTHHT